jgi:hypothetical protein
MRPANELKSEYGEFGHILGLPTADMILETSRCFRSLNFKFGGIVFGKDPANSFVPHLIVYSRQRNYVFEHDVWTVRLELL